MKVVCTNISKLELDGKTPTDLKNINLTIGKHYIVIDSIDYIFDWVQDDKLSQIDKTIQLYLIKDDLGLTLRHRGDQFITLEEWRNKRLKELGI